VQALSIDKTAPTLTAGEAGVLNTSSLADFSLAVGLSDSAARVSVRLFNAEGELQLSGTGLAYDASAELVRGDLSALAEGQYTLEISATDLAGNLSQTLSRSLTIDKTAPLARATLSDSQLSRAELQSFEMLLAVDETPVSLSARLLNANAQLQSVTLTYSALTGKLSGDLSGLASGTYTLELTPRDSAGNVGSVFSQSLSVDQLAPVLSLGALADNQLSGAELANFFQALVLDDASASVLVSLRNAAGTEQNAGLLAYADGRVSGDLSSLADGSYQLSVQARDPSGNLGEPAFADPGA
jgi:hypothetical protein